MNSIFVTLSTFATFTFLIVKKRIYEINIAQITHPIANHISQLEREKSRALRNITVSTHSLTTLAKARIESIQI
jgi:hypothetical protein